jgi:hypothetical protein
VSRSSCLTTPLKTEATVSSESSATSSNRFTSGKQPLYLSLCTLLDVINSTVSSYLYYDTGLPSAPEFPLCSSDGSVATTVTKAASLVNTRCFRCFEMVSGNVKRRSWTFCFVIQRLRVLLPVWRSNNFDVTFNGFSHAWPVLDSSKGKIVSGSSFLEKHSHLSSKSTAVVAAPLNT